MTIVRTMMRCKACSYTWSVHPANVATQTCACGGELAAMDMEAESAKLPYKSYRATTDEKK